MTEITTLVKLKFTVLQLNSDYSTGSVVDFVLKGNLILQTTYSQGGYIL